MNHRQLIKNSRLRARDLLARAFTAEQWSLLLNDANDFAATLARRSDPSYFTQILQLTPTGTPPTAGYPLPDDFAAELDVRCYDSSEAMVHADPVLHLGDQADPKAGNPRWIIKGETLFVREAYFPVARVEFEYQRSVPRLFGAKVTAVAGGGATLTIAETAISSDDAFEGEVIGRDKAYVGSVIEVTTSAADKWKRAKVTAQTGFVITVSPALAGLAPNDTIAAVPLYPEDTHAFLALQAVMDAYSSEDNVRGINTVGVRYKEWRDQFTKAIESRVEGRSAPIQDATQFGTLY